MRPREQFFPDVWNRVDAKAGWCQVVVARLEISQRVHRQAGDLLQKCVFILGILSILASHFYGFRASVDLGQGW